MPALDPVAIGKRLELLRESRNLSQRHLAKLSGVAQSAISDFEQGKRIPTTRALNKLLRFFEIDPSELMVTTAQPDPEESQRQFLIRHIKDQLRTLHLEELKVVAQIVDSLFGGKAARNRAVHQLRFDDSNAPKKRPSINHPDSGLEANEQI